MRTVGPSVSAVGRDAELGAARSFLFAESGARALVLTGGPGIGKTTLWEAGLAEARGRGMQVLSTRASTADARLPLAGLIDLCEGIGSETLDSLPWPQRSALEVALLRVKPSARAPEPHAVALGFLNALRAMAERAPVVLAIDDLQWLDQASSDVVTFAARRLEAEDVVFLVVKRTGPAGALERALDRGHHERLEVGPLSPTAIRRLLVDRLGVSRRLMREDVEATGGNPLFALEVGRVLATRGGPEIGRDIPVPDAVEDMLGTRVDGLPAGVRRLLLAVALSGEPGVAELEGISDEGSLREAVDSGVLVVERDRVRSSHPLLAAAARKRSHARERRRVHRALADAVADPELRTLHLALAAEGADEALVAAAAAAAAAAYARGARQQAGLLAEHALRLTPPASSHRDDRVLRLADYLETAGEIVRMTELLSAEVTTLPAGPARARAWLLLCDGTDVATLDEADRLLDRALSECGEDRALRAQVLAKKAIHAAGIAVSRNECGTTGARASAARSACRCASARAAPLAT